MCALSALRRAGGSYGVLVSKLRICRWGLADARWGSTVTGNKLHLHALRPVDSEKSFVPGRGVSCMLPGWRVYRGLWEGGRNVLHPTPSLFIMGGVIWSRLCW